MNYPEGLALDAKGDVFIADSANSKVFELTRSVPPALSFATTNVGATSSDSPQPVVFENIGNAPLKVAGVSYPTDFPAEAGSGGCFAVGLAPGATCSLAVNFTPKSGGALSEKITVTDNALNQTGATQTIAVGGTGVQTTPTVTVTPASLTFASTLVGAASAAQAVTVKNTGTLAATISSASFTGTNESSFLVSSNNCAALAAGASLHFSQARCCSV